QVLSLTPPHVDPQERGVAVAPVAILLDPLGHGRPHVRDGDAVIREAELGVVDQVADDGGVVVRCHGAASPCSCWFSVRGRSAPAPSGLGWAGWGGPGGLEACGSP